MDKVIKHFEENKEEKYKEVLEKEKKELQRVREQQKEDPPVQDKESTSF
ncbi:hypothetical protein M5X00_13315 [Paenibacillus alvei]|nr:hypothetical protein [Paenibacillus alvei]MCY9540497.1 hypothetical protein [Paenibacillus alvei]MCY9708299.1 hypothetical protein [Paenibacillus alvei]MCY9733013.1 hypothetical protein [Paenibacillus alvei]MCY9755220.1 hypothetical protein [Paenibacillus alvei]MEC0080302.1 hypothetical protein [Paenibacillus alvei]